MPKSYHSVKLPTAVPAIDRRIAVGSETRMSSRAQVVRPVDSSSVSRRVVPTVRPSLRRFAKRHVVFRRVGARPCGGVTHVLIPTVSVAARPKTPPSTMAGMRSFSLIPTVLSVAVVLVGGCSSQSSPPAESAASAPPSSSTKQSDDALPDAAALLQEASTTTRALKSTHLVMSVEGKVAEVPVKALEAGVTLANAGAAQRDVPSPTATPTEDSTAPEDGAAGTAAPNNAAAKGSGKVGILGSDIKFHFVVVDGHLYVSLPGAAWVDYGPTVRPYSVTAFLSPDEGLSNVLANFVDPKVDGRETVDDQQTIRVTGKVTPTAVNKFMPQLGATDRMPATVWIQESGDREVVELSLEPSKGNFLQFVFSEWNKPVTVKKPKGV